MNERIRGLEAHGNRSLGISPMGIALFTAALLLSAPSQADDDAPNPAPPAAPRATAAPALHGSDPGIRRTDAAPDAASPGVRFTTDAKWQVAGYNDNEIVYTILVKDEDTAVIRCTTLMQGVYVENGRKINIADRQTTTILPGQQVQVGNWMGMDRQSGASYSVKCKPA